MFRTDFKSPTMTDSKKFIPALGYRFLNPAYDAVIKLTMPEKKFREMLLQQVNPQPFEKILDFGFGTASQTLLLKQFCPSADIIGVDVDSNILDIAKKKLKKEGLSIQLDLYDGYQLPYSDNSFDKILSSLVFHQLDRIAKVNALTELFRVLKPSGTLHILDWGKARTLYHRVSFFLVQCLDGFANTKDNLAGRLPKFMQQTGFVKVQESEALNTWLGSLSLLLAAKPQTP